MKPVRGSSRPPKLKNRKKPGKRSSEPQKEPDPATVRRKSTQKASGKSRSSGQEKWQPLTRSSIAALRNILDLSVLTCLNQNRREKEETRQHLNILKNRLEGACAGLRVPPVARKDYEASPGRLQEESRRSLDGKKSLSLLESDLDKLLAVLEDREEEKQSLEQSCSSLRHQLEEEQAVEMMQLAERGVLRIPVPPKIHKYTSTLQAQLSSLVPGGEESEEMARQLGDVLLTSEPLQDARHLLANAGHYADWLLSAGPTRPVDQTQ